MNQSPENAGPILRYQGRATIDWRGSVALLDHASGSLLSDALATGTYEVTIEVVRLVRSDGQMSRSDLRQTEAFRLARAAFGDSDDKAEEWLRSPCRALGGAIPVELVQTSEGRRAVEATILGIAHGNFQ